MKFTVTWADEVIGQLGRLWEAAGMSKAITQASAKVDKRLKFDPRSEVEPVSEGLYSITEYPLRCLVTISDDDRIVDVVRIGLLGREKY